LAGTSHGSWVSRAARAIAPRFAIGSRFAIAPAREGVDETPDLGRRLDPQLVLEDASVALELADRLHPIAFGEVDPDELVMGTFPERLAGHRGEPDLDRERVLPDPGQVAGQPLQRVQADLPELLPMPKDPVIRPIDEQVAGGGQGIACHRERIAAERRIVGMHIDRERALRDPACHGPQLMEVDGQRRIHAEHPGRCPDDARRRAWQPPERCAEVGHRLGLRCVWPQGPSDPMAGQGTHLEREEGKQTLTAHRHGHDLTVLLERERRDQPQPC
jgi:hypothetical protein